MRRNPDTTDDTSSAILDAVQSNQVDVCALADAFPDPADAFIMSPLPIDMRTLVNMYIDKVSETDAVQLPRELRRRVREERWLEKRAIFQAQRMAARKELVLGLEAQVMAIVSLEFQSKRIRAMWERWESLSEIVAVGLEECVTDKVAFSTSLRDACRVLDELEKNLAEVVMPPGLQERSNEFWQIKSGDRESMLSKIEEKLRTADGGNKAESVFTLINGGAGSQAPAVIENGED